ncbi:MAG TPA: sulfatase [Myxococcota bacterium]|nr:sulfatase [Myxococcota bacterium]
MPHKLAASLAALAALLAVGCHEPPAIPRNLVLISLDTLRADHLGLYGYGRKTSPELDRWSEHAFVFTNAVSASNYTLAAHHALFQSKTATVARDKRFEGLTLAEMLKAQGFRTTGFTGGGMMTKVSGFDRGFDYWEESHEMLADTLPGALEFLDDAARGKERFYLLVHCLDVHLPYDPPAPYDSMFAPDYHGSVTGPQTRNLLGMRKMFEGRQSYGRHRYDDADKDKVRALYDGEIARMDEGLGKLLARIGERDLRDDTLVVVLADHGEEFWDHGSVLHAHTVFQELIHVPLLMRVPALEKHAHRIAQRVSLVDVVPTLLELLGLPVPAGLQGVSLVPLLHGEPEATHPLFAEGYASHAKLQSVIDGDLKLIRDLDTHGVALFDLAADPGETNDIAADRPADVDRMQALLDSTLGATRSGIQDPLGLPKEVDTKTKDQLRHLGYIE